MSSGIWVDRGRRVSHGSHRSAADVLAGLEDGGRLHAETLTAPASEGSLFVAEGEELPGGERRFRRSRVVLSGWAAKGVYGHFTRVTDPATLTTIYRQPRAADHQLINLVHEGRGSEALDLLRTQGRLIVGENLASTLNGQLVDWHRDYATGADVVMIARRNRDVEYLNDCARELRREAGALGDAEVIVGERAFAAGDRVLTRINREGAVNRERWDVLAVDAAARTVTLRRIGGEGRR